MGATSRQRHWDHKLHEFRHIYNALTTDQACIGIFPRPTNEEKMLVCLSVKCVRFLYRSEVSL